MSVAHSLLSVASMGHPTRALAQYGTRLGSSLRHNCSELKGFIKVARAMH